MSLHENRGGELKARKTYRKVTERAAKVVIEELVDEFKEDYGASMSVEERDRRVEVFNEGWLLVDIATGKFPMKYDREVETVMILHSSFLQHGVRYEEVHNPDKVKLVGGCQPF